ncbi:Lar family restriction alleviation protein [Morganella morganii]|uniref:Lar family restriction alleviation protein n=1 Tax=Morganella morganii TaxID=582 RepID=UPI003743D85F
MTEKGHELKPCPFCGCTDITIHCPSSHGLTLYGVACDGCGVRMKRFNETESVNAWNRREAYSEYERNQDNG